MMEGKQGYIEREREQSGLMDVQREREAYETWREKVKPRTLALISHPRHDC